MMTRLESLLRNFLKYFFGFLLIFDLRIPGLPSGVGSSLICVVLLLLVLLFSGKKKIIAMVIVRYRFLIFLHFVIIVYALFRVMLAGAEDLTIIPATLKSLTLFVACIMYFCVFDEAIKESPSLIFWLFLLNAIICFIAGAFPSVLAVARIFQHEVLTENGGIVFRNAFFSGSGYFSIGTAYGLAFLFIIYCFSYDGRKLLAVEYLGLTLIVAAGALAARTSMFAFVLGVIYLAFRRFSNIFLIAALFGVFFVLFVVFPDLGIYNNWLFEFVKNGGESGSTDALFRDMYFLPDMETLIIGDGKHNVPGGFYGGSDAGYMRNILFGGIPYLFLLLLFPVSLAAKIVKVSVPFSFVVLLSILAFHAKGSFIYNNAQGMAVFYIMYVYFARTRQEVRRIAQK